MEGNVLPAGISGVIYDRINITLSKSDITQQPNSFAWIKWVILAT